ncbi:MAG TPA: twitching motility protein PilT [Puia sp.]|jgi:predicted nucleic acid-binding protein|nr:twitching motility protein PilT [Puia sp.]
MKVFADANILVSVVNREYPLFPFTSRILSLAGTPDFSICTSPICLAIAFYFAEKKSSAAVAKEKLKILSTRLIITSAGPATVHSAFSDPAALDFEDGLQYYSALEAGCNCLLTEDIGDFHFSRIEVVSSKEFFKRHLHATIPASRRSNTSP